MTSSHVAPSSDAPLLDTLVAQANPAGGWGYQPGRASRLEPTAWALLALSRRHDVPGVHAAYLMSRQAPSGWLTEDPRWPINIGMNALVAAAWLAVPALSTPESTQRLLAALINAKGVQAPPMEGSRQNNQLQGWSWTDATFSWVEPTAWALLALKRARRGRLAISGLDARIDEAERLLIDRVCAAGGWNFGNPMTMGLDLAAYVPTTAVVLLAMQDRITVPAVARSLDYLAAHGADEQSSLAMGLAVAALRTCGRRSVAFERQLTSSVNASLAMSVPSRAIAALALSPDGGQVAFGI